MRNLISRRIICTFLAIITVMMSVRIKSGAEKEEKLLFCEVLIEASGGTVIEGVNEDTPVPVGTMAKLMTVLLAAERVESGELSLDDKLKTSPFANSMQGAQVWLMPGEEITVDELFKSVIIGNANDAAAVLAEEISGSAEKFTALMNLRAAELGMKNTVFTNFNGHYDDSEQISTAKDIALLCVKLAEYDFLKEYFTCWRDFVRNGETELVNANTLVKSYKGIVGFKAGRTDSSGYCVAAGAERDGIMYISVVLGSDDEDLGFSEAKRMMNSGFSGYTVFVPELPEQLPAAISVRKGMAREVPLEYGNVRRVVLPNGAVNSVSSRVVITDYVYAPVEKGDKVGEIQFLRGNKMMFASDICAAESVEKITVPKALVIIFKKLLTF